MRASPAAVARLRELERLALRAYRDEGGKWTIGYGDTADVNPGDVIDETEAERRLSVRVDEFSAAVSKALKRPATQSQFDALFIFAYNVGVGALQTSTLLQLFNAGETARAAREFAKWIYVRGPEVQLKLNDTGEDVESLQRELRDLGFKVAVDGDFGPATEAAVKAWQKKLGAEQTGVLKYRPKRISQGLVARRFDEALRFVTT
jgi:lysozyme